jgi:hypothetical protein
LSRISRLVIGSVTARDPTAGLLILNCLLRRLPDASPAPARATPRLRARFAEGGR